MILQSSYRIVNCPVCGRSLKMRAEHVNDKVACGHCHGLFNVSESIDGSLTTRNRQGVDLLTRADQLLRTLSDTELRSGNRCCQRRVMSASVSSDNRRPGRPCLSTVEKEAHQPAPLPTAVLVEHRDEVFARIATDMAEAGMRVIRAKSATEALNLCSTGGPVLLVGFVNLLDHSGWLLADKLRLIDRGIPVWLYQSQSSDYEQGMAGFLNLDALLEYRGDLLRLSALIVALIAKRNKRQNCFSDARNNEGPSAC